MKPANATVQDDIPPVHVLEAAQNQDRKETEDLLAGFDRPGRGPKPVSKSKERDFVDYYARKKPGSADSGGERAAANANASANAPVDAKVQRQADLSTVIVHRKRAGTPAWLGWAAAALGMLVVGGAVAYLATADGGPSVVAPTAPSAATTITSAMSPPRTSADTNIPAPAPADPTTATVVEPAPAMTSTSVTAPRGSAKRDARAGGSASAGASGVPGAAAVPAAPRGASTTATDGTKPPPRDDFIRDL